MTREKARDDGSDVGYALSRTHSIPRTMSSFSSDSDRSRAESDMMDPYDVGSDDDDDELREKRKGRRVFSSTAEEADSISNMSYMQRRKYMSRVKIEFNTTGEDQLLRVSIRLIYDCIASYWREQFLIKLAQSLMTFGAPSHRIEAQLLAASKVLEVDAEFIHIPGLIMCSFNKVMMRASDLRFVKCAGALDLGSLHAVHHLYRQVVHDEVSAKVGVETLEHLLAAKPGYRRTLRIIMAFCLSAMICPLAFGGSIIDMWVAGATGAFLSVMQVQVAARSTMYAAVYE